MKTFIRSIATFNLICILLCGLFGPTTSWASEGNIDTTNKYAWSENAGWLNFRSSNGGVTVHETYLSGYAWAENIGWIKLGSGTGPYSNASSTNWGVNRNSGTNALSGYAWSENVGWINFDSSNGLVTVNTSTGEFDGYAWAENVGWIHFKNDDPAYNVKVSNITPGTYYVNIENGNDANDGSSSAQAWKTLHYAVFQINIGSTGTYILYVAPGGSSTRYRVSDGEEDSELLISQNNVTVIGETGTVPIIDGTGATADWPYGIKITGSNVTLKNLHITGFTGTDPEGTGIEIVAGSNNTIFNCRVYGNYDGISVSQSANCTIRDCEIDNNNVDGISISESADSTITRNTIHDNYEINNSDGIIVQACSPEISRNTIYDNRFNISLQADGGETTSPTIKNNQIYQVTSGEVKYGILMGGDGTTSPNIYHNTIDGGSEDGINIDGTGNAPDIKYNIITGFGDYGVYNQNGNPVIDYNDVWNNTGGTYFGCVDPVPGGNNISADPQYTSYTLAATSPCINTIPAAEGDPVTLDYSGYKRPRPGEDEKDMGAHEYVAEKTVNYTMPGGTGTATDYRIFTVPLDLGTGTHMLTAMENVLGPYNPAHWRGFLYTGTGYREFNSSQFASATIKPGMGFWIITTYTNQIPFQGGLAPDGVDYVMDLAPGWHLIGLPWLNTRISLGNIDVTDGVNTYAVTGNDNTLTQKYLWDYTGSGPDSGYVKQNSAAFQLQNNTGYFFKVLGDETVRVIIPHNDNQGQDAPFDTIPNEIHTNEDDEAPPPPPGAEPVPDIKANGQDGPVSVNAGDSVSISVSLDPGAWNGRNADWWVAAHTPFDPPLDWYSYVHMEGWRYGIHVCIQMPLYELTPSFTVLNTVLPVGNYVFYFAVDGNMDGVTDATWQDFVEVNVK